MIERFALWDGPAMFILIAASTCSHGCHGDKNWPSLSEILITNGDQFSNALKQLLPLAIFPLLFFIFEIPVFTFHVYRFHHSTPNEGIVISAYVCVSLWSMASGATVIIHISVARICGRKRKVKLYQTK